MIEVNKDTFEGGIALSRIRALDQASVTDVTTFINLVNDLLHAHLDIALIISDQLRNIYWGHCHEFERSHKIRFVIMIIF